MHMAKRGGGPTKKTTTEAPAAIREENTLATNSRSHLLFGCLRLFQCERRKDHRDDNGPQATHAQTNTHQRSCHGRPKMNTFQDSESVADGRHKFFSLLGSAEESIDIILFGPEIITRSKKSDNQLACK
jgi:hypothetical protein